MNINLSGGVSIETSPKKAKIYTDASYLYNERLGGIGFIEVLNDKIIQRYFKLYPPATRSVPRLEAEAIALAIEVLKTKYDDLEVFCDNKEIVEIVTKKCFGMNEIAYLDVAKKIAESKVKINYIKGHSGDKFNEEAHQWTRGKLCAKLVEKMKGREL